MTLIEIGKSVGRFKRLSRTGIHFHLRALRIKRLGHARPVNYADDTADKIIARLGFTPANGHQNARKAKGRR